MKIEGNERVCSSERPVSKLGALTGEECAADGAKIQVSMHIGELR